MRLTPDEMEHAAFELQNLRYRRWREQENFGPPPSLQEARNDIQNLHDIYLAISAARGDKAS